MWLIISWPVAYHARIERNNVISARDRGNRPNGVAQWLEKKYGRNGVIVGDVSERHHIYNTCHTAAATVATWNTMLAVSALKHT